MIDISDRRELFCDDFLVDAEKTTAETELFKPRKREIAFHHDAAWEKEDVVYHNIVALPGGGYRMYYKSNYNDWKPDGAFGTVRRICFIESKDGINWTRPELDVLDFQGAPTNIISWDGWFFDNMFVFYDNNPDCPANEKFKALYGEWGNGLFGYFSEDGIHFRFAPRDDGVVIGRTKNTGCYFDSLNTAYWDARKKKYVTFVRGFHIGNDWNIPDPDDDRAVRDIRYMESPDFRNWSEPVPFEYNDENDYQLYANCIVPYPRAPHIYTALPTRYIARPEWDDSFEKLCGAEARRERGRGRSLNDAIFMSSRDAKSWSRYGEAVITSGPEQPDGWVYGDCYPCVGFIDTPSAIPDTDSELSFYMKERQRGEMVLYRYTMRKDGFVARRGDLSGKKLITKPFTFEGKELEINFSTSALGSLTVKLTDAENGKTVSSCPHFGDKTDRVIAFDGELSSFAGKPVVMEIDLFDARIYSFKFNK